MFINFIINNKKDNFDYLIIHFCDDNNLCNSKNVELYKVSSICYLGLTIDEHMRWNLLVNNLVQCLCILSFSFYKLRKIIPMKVIRIVYLASYQNLTKQ